MLKEKSIYNMIVSILSCVAIIPLFVVGVLSKGMNKEILSVIFMSIFYPILMVCYIIKSIYYAKEESTSKVVLYRLSKVFMDVATTLIVINFILLLNHYIKWILLGIVLFLMILEILLDSFDQITEFKYLFSAMKAAILIFGLFSMKDWNGIMIIGMFSIFLCYISNLLGKILQNKIVLSYEIVSLILFGIFLILI